MLFWLKSALFNNLGPGFYLYSMGKRAWPVLSHQVVRIIVGAGALAVLLAGCKATKPAGNYSSATDFYNARQFEKPKEFEPLALYTYHPTDFLVGNACVTEYTKTLGFEYTYPFTTPNERPNKLYTFVHNMYVNTRLLRRLGFGWKRRLKSRIKQCRTSSGDYSG